MTLQLSDPFGRSVPSREPKSTEFLNCESNVRSVGTSFMSSSWAISVFSSGQLEISVASFLLNSTATTAFARRGGRNFLHGWYLSSILRDLANHTSHGALTVGIEVSMKVTNCGRMSTVKCHVQKIQGRFMK